MVLLLMTRALSPVLRPSFLLAILLVIAGCSTEPPYCGIDPVARLKIQSVHGLPLVAVALDGKPVWMIADTGAERSLLTDAAATRLQLRRDIGHVSHTMGIGGASTEWDVAIDSFVMGGVRFRPVTRLAVGHFVIGDTTTSAPAGLLGADILLAYDLDIDISDNSITLYRARRCKDARPPWTEPAIPIEGVTARKDRVQVPLTLDGVTASGTLDTGAELTTIGSRLAARVGVPEASMANDPTIMTHGAGPDAVPSHVHAFASLTIGPVTLTSPNLTVLPSETGVGEALVGQDFLRGRHVWISFASEQVYVSALPGDKVTNAAAP
jgi:predicted aspartyl protease